MQCEHCVQIVIIKEKLWNCELQINRYSFNAIAKVENVKNREKNAKQNGSKGAQQ